MRLRLIPDARRVFKHAWSIRLLAIAGILSGIEAALPFVTWLPIPEGVFAILAFVATGGAFVARLLAQQGLTNADDA